MCKKNIENVLGYKFRGAILKLFTDTTNARGTTTGVEHPLSSFGFNFVKDPIG